MPSKSDNPNPKKFDGNGEKSFKPRKSFNKGGDQNKLSRRRDHPIRKGPQDRQKMNGKVFNQGQPVCMYCLGLGHVFKDCPEADENVKNRKMCFNCGEEHPLKDCPKKRSKGLPFASCFVCKEKGHLAITCKKKPNPEQYDKYKVEPNQKRKFNNNNNSTDRNADRNTNRNTDGNADNNKGQNFQKDENRLKCLCCFQYGHIMQDCPAAPESMKKNDLCFNCGKNDHTCRNCPLPKQTPYPFAICFVCQGQGHLANECPTRVRTKKGKKDEAPIDDTFQNTGTGADDDNYTESFRGNNNNNTSYNKPQGNFRGNRQQGNFRQQGNRPQGNRPFNKSNRNFGNRGNQGGKSFGQRPAQKPSGNYKKFD